MVERRLVLMVPPQRRRGQASVSPYWVLTPGCMSVGVGPFGFHEDANKRRPAIRLWSGQKHAGDCQYIADHNWLHGLGTRQGQFNKVDGKSHRTGGEISVFRRERESRIAVIG